MVGGGFPQKPGGARWCKKLRSRDGMNLVAKEYVAAQDPQDPGVLILSKFAGAAQQLSGALIVNPNDKVEVAEAIRDALHMAQAERADRWNTMIGPLRDHNVSWWAAAFLKELMLGVGSVPVTARLWLQSNPGSSAMLVSSACPHCSHPPCASAWCSR